MQGIGVESTRAEIPSSLRTVRTAPMLISLRFTSAIISLLVGAFLLYSPISGPDTNQVARLLGGATLVSLGLVTTLLTVKDWLVWKRHYKNEGGRDHG
jgi:hypothetical protein